MPISIGEGAARGLESGLRIGQGFIDQRQREEDRQRAQQQQEMALAQQQEDRSFQRQRLEAQDARLAAQDRRQVLADERQQNLDAEQALGQEFADLQAEGKGMLEQYGDFGKVPKDLGESYALRVKDTRGRLQAQRAKRYAPLVEQQRQAASQLWSRIQTGEVPLDQVPDDQLVSSLTALTRRDVRDFMPEAVQGIAGAQPTQGGLSPIQQAGRDFQVGAQTGNDEMMINAANTLFKPELMIGVGGPGRDGSEILSKKIVQLIPHPNDPTHFTPLLEIKVKREDGKVGTYRAPVTENRSSEPDDNIKTLSIQSGLERVGQLTTLAEALNQRGILEKMAKGINDAGEGPKNFLEAYYATGGQKPTPKKIDVGHFEDFGGYKVHYLPDGREVRIEKTPVPKAPGGGAGGGDGESLDEQDMRFMARQYLKGDSSVFTNLGRGAQGAHNIVRLRKAVREEAEASGMGGADVAAAMATFQGDKAAARSAGTKGANIDMAVAEATELSDLALQASEKVGRTKFVPVNKALRYLETQTGDPAIREFGAANLAFINTYARAISPSGTPTVHDKQHAEEMLSTADGPEAYKAVVLQLRKEMAAAQKSPSTVRARIAARVAGREEAAPEPRGMTPPAPGAQPAGINLGPSRVPARPQAQQQAVEGSIAVNPQTGERLQLRGGQWVPVK